MIMSETPTKPILLEEDPAGLFGLVPSLPAGGEGQKDRGTGRLSRRSEELPVLKGGIGEENDL